MRSNDVRFPRLLTAITVGKHVLRNRLVMGSMHARLEIRRGVSGEGSNELNSDTSALAQRAITAAVHEHDCKIILQILHAGRYGQHDLCVGPSAQRPIRREKSR